MRIAFFGLPQAALLLERDRHELVYAGICRKGAIGTRRLVGRIGRERVAIRPDPASTTLLRRLKQAQPELVVSWFWTQKLPPAILTLAPLGTVGVHPSLLPRHRGPDPYFWAIDSGDRETGVTAHRLEAEYDTGAILAQRTLPLSPTWNAWQLAKALDRPSLALLREVVGAFAHGAPPPEHPQDESLVTHAPEPSGDDLVLRWSWTTERILRRIRAASPWPGALAMVGDVEIAVLRARAAPDVPETLLPGEGAVWKGRALIRCGDGGIELLEGEKVEVRAGEAQGDPTLDGEALARLIEGAREDR